MAIPNYRIREFVITEKRIRQFSIRDIWRVGEWYCLFCSAEDDAGGTYGEE